MTLNEKGKDDPVPQEKKKELRDTWNNIMVGIQDKLQRDIDNYFKILKV